MKSRLSTVGLSRIDISAFAQEELQELYPSTPRGGNCQRRAPDSGTQAEGVIVGEYRGMAPREVGISLLREFSLIIGAFCQQKECQIIMIALDRIV